MGADQSANTENTVEEPRTVPGKNGGTLTPWVKGQVPNRTGRPKWITEFAWDCRRAAKKLLPLLTSEKVKLAQVASFQALCERGGVLALAEEMKLLLQSLTLPTLTAEQRDRLIKAFAARSADLEAIENSEPV